jgi:SAM-dependent methyltransferase
MKNFLTPDESKADLLCALAETAGWFAFKQPYGTPRFKRTQDLHVHQRHDICVRFVVPWVQKATAKQRFARMLDFGCGTGSTSCAFAPFVDEVVGIDIDDASVSMAHRRATILKRPNIRSLAVPASATNEAAQAESAKGDGFDLIVLHAVLEHQTVDERLSTLKCLWALLGEGGILVVTETPNRLVWLDHHSSQMPFGHLLPFELKKLLYQQSPRAAYVKHFDNLKHLANRELEEKFTRFGDCVSYHEFELALGELGGFVVGDGFDDYMLDLRPYRLDEQCLLRYFAEAKLNNVPCGFSRFNLDFVLRKTSNESLWAETSAMNAKRNLHISQVFGSKPLGIPGK